MQVRGYRTVLLARVLKGEVNLSYFVMENWGQDMTWLKKAEYLGIVRIFCVRVGRAAEPGSALPGQGRGGGGETGGGLQRVIGLGEGGPGGYTLLARDKGKEERAGRGESGRDNNSETISVGKQTSAGHFNVEESGQHKRLEKGNA